MCNQSAETTFNWLVKLKILSHTKTRFSIQINNKIAKTLPRGWFSAGFGKSGLLTGCKVGGGGFLGF